MDVTLAVRARRGMRKVKTGKCFVKPCGRQLIQEGSDDARFVPVASFFVNVGKEAMNSIGAKDVIEPFKTDAVACMMAFFSAFVASAQLQVKKTIWLSASRQSSSSIAPLAMAVSTGSMFQPEAAGQRIVVRRRISAIKALTPPSKG